jgi:hypothetical protein
MVAVNYDPIFGYTGLDTTKATQKQKEGNVFEIMSDMAGMPTRLPLNAPKREQGRRMKKKKGLMYASDGRIYEPRRDGWRRVHG